MSKITTFKANKTKIALYKIKEVRSVIINVMIHAGSYYEKSDNWGSFHFLEHLVFDGTEKLPTYQDIENFKYEHGVNFNGSTSNRYVSFWFKFPDTEINAGLFFMDQILFHPTFPENQFTKEISIISQEFQNSWDSPHRRFDQALYGNLFGSKNPITRDGIGQPDFIKKLNRSDLINLHQQFFQPQNMVIGVAGNFNSKAFSEKLKKILNQYLNTTKIKTNPAKLKTGQSIFNYQDNVNQGYLVINYVKNKRYSLQEKFALNMASFMIGKGTNSILFKKLRHDLGLVYNINSSSTPWLNLRNFEIWSSIDPKNIDQVISIIKNEINQFMSQKIDQNLFQKTRQYMNLQTLSSFDSIYDISNSLVNDLFYEDKSRTPDEIIKIANQITPDQLLELLHEIIDPKNMTINMMTPNKPEN